MALGRYNKMRGLAITMCVVAWVGTCAWSQEQPKRWDQIMIDEAATWKPLMAPYINGTPSWPAPAAGADRTLRDHPNTHWANIARIILAGGAATTEGGLPKAMEMLDSVDVRISADMILTGWRSMRGCVFDQLWMRNAGSLVFLNEDGTVRITKPFDKDGSIHFTDQEVLAYFQHLAKYPRSARAVSSLVRAQILLRARQNAKAIALLEQMRKNAKPKVAEVAAADRKAANAEDGTYLRRLWRPEYEAWLILARGKANADANEASDIMLELAQLASPTGGVCLLNEMAGDFALKAGRDTVAKEQFQLAANGLREDIAREQEREGKLERVPLPPGVERIPEPADLLRKLEEVEKKTPKN